VSIVNAGAGEPVRAALPPLSRNRDYNLLWTSQVVSQLGTQLAFIAFPLLILATSHSPVQMGIVAGTGAAVRIAANVPAGMIVDRYSRKKIMLTCEAIRAAAFAGLATSLLTGTYSFSYILAVVVIEGLCGSLFTPAEQASLPRVVPRAQLSAAIARNTARPFVAGLLGPVAGGLLFAFQRMLPFLADAISYALSFAGLLFLRLPRRGTGAAVKSGAFEGIRWVLRQRVIRVTLTWVAASNLIFAALVIVILAVAGRAHASSGEIGLMMTTYGAGGLLGATVAARLHAALPPSVIVLGFSWIAAAMTLVMTAVPGGEPLGLVISSVAFFAPAANTTILTYEMMITPDELRGRLSATVGLCTGVAGALGPLLGGFLIDVTDRRTALLACSASLAVVALVATLSPTMRRFPILDKGMPENVSPETGSADADGAGTDSAEVGADSAP
jgi:MFS family permease